MKKRVLSLLLTLALCFTMLPAAAFAAEADPAGQETQSDSATGEVQSAGEENGTAVQAGETTHEHFLCGGTTCNQEGHALEDGMTTFEPWNGSTSGTFYLNSDLDLISTLTVRSGSNLTLCLNGYDITMKAAGDAIMVEEGGTFTLCDCKRGGTTDYGTIRHSDSLQFNGRGVTVETGTFNMYGGKITNNTVGSQNSNNIYGGGVVVCNKGTFNMIGGEITGNKARYGGGVGVGLASGIHDETNNDIGGTFNMTGGKIYGNFCVTSGGGVYASASSKLHFSVSGSAEITENYTGDYLSSSSDDGKTNNVYLSVVTDSKTGAITDIATIEVGTLTTGASIGVTTEEVGQIVATGVSAAAKKYFFSDSGKYRLKYDSSASTLTMIAVTEHAAHPICGDANCEDSSHALPDGKSWVPVSDLSKITADGYYYLTDDVTISSTWEPKDGVVLCLNGYSITADGNFDTITVGKDVTFTLCDCIGGGEITHAEGKSGTGVYMKGTGSEANKKATFNMYSGTITGNTGHTVTTASNVTSIRGGGVYVGYYAQFHMSGGGITGNTADVGGGVYYDSDVARYFTVSGNVKITGNQGTDGKYNNVYVPDASGSDDGCYKFTIGEGGLGEDAEIGITFGGTLATGEKITFALHAERGYYDGNFTYDNNDGNYGFKKEADTWNDQTLRGTHVVNLYNGLHEHPLCGKTCEHAGDGKHTDDLLWTPLTYENGYLYAGGSTVWTTGNSWDTVYYQLTEGNYYLPESITIDKPIMIRGDVNLCLNGNTLSTNTALPTDDSIIAFFTVYENCTLTLCDCGTGGTIRTDNNLHYGVNTWYPFDSDNTSHTAGNFTMYGGTITGVQRGVRLCVETNGGKSTFKMYGGKITGTKRGVYVNDGSIFEMYGGEITGNDTEPTLVEDKTYFGGGVVVDIGATFTMKGGTISNNNAYSGGGVCLLGDSSSATTTFTMEGGTITGNTTTGGGGGGVYLGTNTAFNMSGDAAVSGNTIGGSCGGGVYVPTNSSFAMSGDATVSGNSAKYGGGVYVAGGTFNMSKNAAISGNNAGNGDYTGEGGGVCVVTGTFNMTGGSITGNNVHLGSNAPEGEGGGGVYVAPNATAMNVSGDVQIHDNWKNGTLNAETGVYKQDNGSANNLYLFAHKDDSVLKTVTIDGVLESTARIGVTTRYTPTASDPVKFATGATEDQAYYTAIFTPDDQTKGYMITQKDETLYLSTHQHSWSYTANGATITATCEDTDCTSRGGGSVTIKAPDKSTLTYDGNAKKATLDNKLTTGVTEPTIYYSMAGEPGGDLAAGSYPTVVGSYTASITVGGATASVPYEIAKGEPTLTLPTVEATYEQHLKDIEIVNPQGNPEGTWTWENGETYLNSVGEKTYNAIFTPKDSSNYLTVTKSLTVTVNPKQYTDGIRLKEEYDYTYNGKQKTPSFFTSGMQSGRDYTWAYGENINAGENAGSVTVSPLNGGYYTFEPITVYFNILPKGITVSGITAEDKYYDGSDTAKLDYTNVKLDGKLDKDDLSVTAKGTFEDADAGENKTVEITDLTLTGTAAGNYILVDSKDQQKSTTATINQMPLTINRVVAYNRVYEPNNKSVMIFSVGFQDKDGQPVELTKSTHYTVTGEMADDNAGEGKTATATVTLIGDTAKNYSLEIPTYDVKVNIDKIAPDLPTGLTGYQGNALSTVDLSKFEGWSWKDGTTVMSETGEEKTFTAHYAGSTNYIAGDYEVTVKVSEKNKVTLTVTKDGWTFGQTESELSVTGLPEGTTLEDAGVSVTYTKDSQTVTERKNAGDYTVTVRYETGDTIYEGTKTFTIAKKQIAIPAADTTEFVYDGSEKTYSIADSKDYEVSGNVQTDAGTHTVTVTLKDTANTKWTDGTIAAKEIDFIIAQAKTTGEPKYTPITSAGKTLEDAHLTLVDSTLDPPAGSLIWIDEDGNALGNNTEVEANKAYGWQFTPSDINYAPLTGEIVPYRVSYTPSYPVNVPEETEHGAVTSSVERAFWGNLVTITVKPDSGYVLETLTVTDQNGKELELTDKGDGVYTFTMPSGEVTIKATFIEDNSILNFFLDVPNDAYYYEAVKWAVENGITNGVGYNLFAPGRPCTRAQIVTFLWRAAGSPEPKNMNSFSDVPAGSYYAKAVAWAVENGIALGVSADRFAPDDTCTRAHAVTFLARALNGKAEGKAEFIDVSENSYYAGAVAWASENGVTEGIGMGKFGPNSDCTRGQIVTFLYRAYNK